MNIEQVREYTLSLAGVTEDQAFGEDILNFRLEGKIFRIFCRQYAINCFLYIAFGVVNRNDKTYLRFVAHVIVR